MIHRGIVLLDKGPGREAMKRHCKAVGVKIQTIERLVEAEFDQMGKRRRLGLHNTFDEIFDDILESTVDVEETLK